MFQMMKAFMKPEQIKQLDGVLKDVVGWMARVESKIDENNAKLDQLLAKKGGK